MKTLFGWNGTGRGFREEPAAPSLFDDGPPIDLDTLQAIGRRSTTRAELSNGYCNLGKSSDLFPHGYSVSHWLDPRTRHQVDEYNPRGPAGASLPRLTADNYADQVTIHRALGAIVLPRMDS
jgi:hypothetical protein